MAKIPAKVTMAVAQAVIDGLREESEELKKELEVYKNALDWAGLYVQRIQGMAGGSYIDNWLKKGKISGPPKAGE